MLGICHMGGAGMGGNKRGPGGARGQEVCEEQVGATEPRVGNDIVMVHRPFAIQHLVAVLAACLADALRCPSASLHGASFARRSGRRRQHRLLVPRSRLILRVALRPCFWRLLFTQSLQQQRHLPRVRSVRLRLVHLQERVQDGAGVGSCCQ